MRMLAKLATALLLLTTTQASAATYHTIYKFCPTFRCEDGSSPLGPVIADDMGNLYGTASQGGAHGEGVVFELVAGPGRTNWTYKILHSFCAHFPCRDGSEPSGGLVRDVNGDLYGTTTAGGGSTGAGVAFELLPHSDGGTWDYHVLHTFCDSDCRDGAYPGTLTYEGAESGALYDGLSPLYGVAADGGTNNEGVIFTLRHYGGHWNLKTIHDYPCCGGGDSPSGAPLFSNGSFYGLTALGGTNDGGTFYQLTQGPHHKWQYAQLFSFGRFSGTDASVPVGPLVRDAAGKFYGTSAGGGKTNQGTLFSLSIDESGVHEQVLQSFCRRGDCAKGGEPNSGILIGTDGALIGATPRGGDDEFAQQGAGTIFSFSDGMLKKLHTFCKVSGCPDGSYPYVSTMDAQGNLFGVTHGGGNGALDGTVFELTP